MTEPTRRGFLSLLAGAAGAIGIGKGSKAEPLPTLSTTPVDVAFPIPPARLIDHSTRRAQVEIPAGAWFVEVHGLIQNRATHLFLKSRATLHLRKDDAPFKEYGAGLVNIAPGGTLGLHMNAVVVGPCKVSAFVRGRRIDSNVELIATWVSP